MEPPQPATSLPLVAAATTKVQVQTWQPLQPAALATNFATAPAALLPLACPAAVYGIVIDAPALY